MVKQIYYDGNHQGMHGEVCNESWLLLLLLVFFLYPPEQFFSYPAASPLPVTGLQI
jgi:hypothetical protein